MENRIYVSDMDEERRSGNCKFAMLRPCCASHAGREGMTARGEYVSNVVLPLATPLAQRSEQNASSP